MSRSKKNKLTNNTSCKCDFSKSFFTGQSIIDNAMLMNNLHFGQSMQSLYYDQLDEFKLLPKLTDIMKSINEKATNHFGDMEFALNEYGEPDGIKNEQEIVLTVASEVSEEVAEEVFNNIKDLLTTNGHINELAMELLKESKEK